MSIHKINVRSNFLFCFIKISFEKRKGIKTLELRSYLSCRLYLHNQKSDPMYTVRKISTFSLKIRHEIVSETLFEFVKYLNYHYFFLCVTGDLSSSVAIPLQLITPIGPSQWSLPS